MKRLCLGFLVIAGFSTCVFAQNEQEKSDEPEIKVARIAVCERVEEREPVAVDSVFVGVEKLCCFTEIKGAEQPTHIQHVWYYGEEELFRITLDVKAVRWRSYSAKNILPEWTGNWRVEIVDAEERKLSEISFKVK